MKKLNGKDMARVRCWIIQFEGYSEKKIQLEDGTYLCEVKISPINVTVGAKGKTDIEAMYNAYKKAAKEIEKWEKNNNPEIKLSNIFKHANFNIIGDDDGNFIELKGEY